VARMPEAAGPRIAMTFVIALVVWMILLVVGHEVNAPSIALGVLLSALVAWWGEKRRALRTPS
jgi:multisubunit Na+/H+ antiporter MnhE subunit